MKHKKELVAVAVFIVLVAVVLLVKRGGEGQPNPLNSILPRVGSPLKVGLTIKPATKAAAGYAMSIGEESTITLTLRPRGEVKNLTAEIILPGGLSLVSGERLYQGGLSDETDIKTRVRASKVGVWDVAAKVTGGSGRSYVNEIEEFKLCIAVIKEDAKKACEKA